jgi:hypothetical protein
LLINTANGIDGKGAGETTVFMERLCKYMADSSSLTNTLRIS